MIEINGILKIKEETILRITQIINEQLILIGLAKTEYMKYEQFKKNFDRLEDEKNVLFCIKEDLDIITSTYIKILK